MLERSELLSLNFYKKEAFQGSYQGLRYQLTMVTEDDEKKLCVIIWPEPYGIEATPEEKKQKSLYSFDEEGLNQAIAWMNEMYPTIKNMVEEAIDLEPVHPVKEE